MKQGQEYNWPVILSFAGVVFGVALISWFGYTRFVLLSQETRTLSIQLAALEAVLASTTLDLRTGLATTQSSFADALNQEKQNIENKLGTVEQKVGTISGTVGTLEKLSKTDPEFLQKYSKVFFLNEHYTPERVTIIEPKYLYSEQNPEVIHASVWPKLKLMLDAAEATGIPLYVKSGYRSFDEQRALKGVYTVTYGAGTANSFSADQGYSEHQLGTTVDVITTGIGGQLEGFNTTAAYQWMLTNAHKYGFTLSYPESNGYYVFEPWHWRYVGVKLATYLHDNGQNFYGLDQRKIDEYLVDIFE